MKFKFVYEFMGSKQGLTTITKNQDELNERMARHKITPDNIISVEVNDEPVDVKELVESGVL